MAVYTPDLSTTYSTGSAVSKDGTTIGYRQLGHGPGVILLHGSMSSSQNHMQLAEALADAFTVYVIDRRGRGLSGAYTNDHSLQTDVDDLDAVLTQTGAYNVFAVSSGAIITLQAALSLPAIHKAAIYEPPLFDEDSTPKAVLTRFDEEMAQGRVAAALITAMQGAQMGPPIFTTMPRWLLEPLVKMAMHSDAKKGGNGYVPMRDSAPTLHYDFQIVAEISGNLERFKAITTDVILLSGSKSPAYLKAALDRLENLLPHAERIEFPGLDHAASWNSDRGGQPLPVAQALRQFFA